MMARSFGPLVMSMQDGTLVARCRVTSGYCVELKSDADGHYCSMTRDHHRVPDPSETPDHCVAKASMIRDAAKMIRLERMGISRMNRSRLLERVRKLPREYMPVPLAKAKLDELVDALIRHEDDGGKL